MFDHILEKILLALLCTMPLAGMAQTRGESLTLAVAAQPIAAALNDFARQTGLHVVIDSQTAKGVTSTALQGTFTIDAALKRLLADTGLRYEFLDAQTVAVLKPSSPTADASPELRKASGSGNELRLAHVEDLSAAPAQQSQAAEAESPKDNPQGIAEILVKGSKLLNMDLKRSRDDAQPYVIFERELIQRSGARNIEDFLKQRLTMNTSGLTFAQSGASQLGNVSQINLRGLGANQTLILVDGHRTADLNFGGDTFQSDLNGIPLAAIERIEVLPTTASGIYGGNATGGVINIILRRDYSGSEVKLTYENGFDADSSVVRADMAAGFNLEGGKTNVLLAGSYSDTDVLLWRDSGLVQRGIATIRANNPNFFAQATTPPLGATANIRSVDGSPLFGPGTPSTTSVPVGYAGGGGLAPLQVNAGQYNYDLPDNRQGSQRSFLNAPRVYSLSTTVRRQFSDAIQAFVEATASNNIGYTPQSFIPTGYTLAASAPNNPFGKAVRVTVPIDAAGGSTVSRFSERRALGGVIFKLPRTWQGEFDFTWNKSGISWTQASRLTTAGTAAIQGGTLDILRDTHAYPVEIPQAYLNPNDRTFSPFEAVLRNWAVRTGGPVALPFAALPTISLSSLVEYRETQLSRTAILSAGGTYTYPDRSYDVASVYLEAKIPFVSARNKRPGIQELELQLAGRHDRYSTQGVTGFLINPSDPIIRVVNKSRSTDPTIGLRYTPVRDLTLRASYGTGFRVPTTSQLAPTVPLPTTGGGFYLDPRRGNESLGAYNLTQGGNPNLRPEQSKSWSYGAVFSPAAWPAFRASVDYTKVEKTDNITQLNSQQILDNESLFPGRVTRAAASPGDPYGVGPVIALDTTAVNIARTNAEAYDVALDYTGASTPWGAFDFFAMATWQTHLQNQLLPSLPMREVVGISSGTNTNTASGIPVKFKANAGVNWRLREWTLGWTSRYFDSYLAADPNVSTSAAALLNQGNGGRVKSQVYHDLYGSFRLPRNTELQAGIKNVFNSKPPFDAGSSPAYYSYLGDPRLATYWLSLKTEF